MHRLPAFQPFVFFRVVFFFLIYRLRQGLDYRDQLQNTTNLSVFFRVFRGLHFTKSVTRTAK